ncbi:MAG: TIGR01906 family membrane protein [Chloroflexi bacterium]|nr:TIGR01906 family membrane protein [Chloroflexota bacterium]
MRTLRLMAVWLFVIAVPVFLITSNVRWVINAPFLYSYGFDKYDISAYTRLERGELLSAARQIRDYFNNDEESITVRVVWQGILVQNLFNEREVIHMRDVKGLVRGVYRVQEFTGLYMLLFAAIGLWIYRRAFLRSLAKWLGLGGLLTLGLVVLVGLASLVGFDRLFLAFHLLSFSNDFWQLDPSRDYLIAMFPEAFFFDATMLIALSTIFEAALLASLPFIFLGWSPKRAYRSARRIVGIALAR